MKISIIAVFRHDEGTNPIKRNLQICLGTVTCSHPDLWEPPVAMWITDKMKELGPSFELRSISHAPLPSS